MVLRGTCMQRLPQLRDWWNGLGGERVAYVNPPRSGLETGVAEALAHEFRPSRLAYLSCSAGTLARDLAILAAAGYRVAAIRPYDFFPLTHHVEALALLEIDPGVVMLNSGPATTTAQPTDGVAVDTAARFPPARSC
jgi:hypothetical protein